MKKAIILSFLALTILVSASAAPGYTHNKQFENSPSLDTQPKKALVIAQMRRVNDYWIANNKDYGSNNWDRSVYYHGNTRLFSIVPDSAYYRYSLGWAQKYNWQPYGNASTRFADDQACGAAYIDLYRMDPKSSKIDPIKNNIHAMVISTKRDDWWWIDALYMAMPVFTKLGKEFNDNSYFQAMYELYNDTKVRRKLYNSADGLWYRDENYDPPYKEPNGKGCYWSRGNGWVFAAHCRTLDELPASDSHRAEYIETFRKMAAALKAVQRTDGLWNSSLLDPNNFGGPEASGTSFFTYGLAWGINNGILDSAEYIGSVIKGWNGLTTVAVHPDGMLGYCQQIGLKPGSATYNETKDYAVGAFLLAGSEVLKISKDSGTVIIRAQHVSKQTGNAFSVQSDNNGALRIQYTAPVDVRSIQFFMISLTGRFLWNHSVATANGNGDNHVWTAGTGAHRITPGVYVMEMRCVDAAGRKTIAGSQRFTIY
jgi:unsaturated rhamnogalacturonyl hydrolase